jgi:(R,R)-butanediol dehydrogenase / meso-butanediol dehydrogenase / diacetyl reductase
MNRGVFYEGRHQLTVGSCEMVAPGPDEVQVKVSYCGICGTDLHLFHGRMDHRMRLPQVFGHEIAGTVEAVGCNVQSFAKGDGISVRPLIPCGNCPACRAGNSHVCQRLRFIGIDEPGGMQVFWTVPAHTLHRLPPNMPLLEASLVEPLAVACHDVRRSRITQGEYAVVQGGGPIGILIALVARQAGARILVAEVNPFRLQLIRELGFEAINPKETDIASFVTTATGTAGADVVFEVSESRPPLTCFRFSGANWRSLAHVCMSRRILNRQLLSPHPDVCH